MGDKSTIEWTDASWNPTRGCSRVSAGCDNCYAIRQAHRHSGPGRPYAGLTRQKERGLDWTGEVREVPEALDLPLRWRAPRRIFVDSMSDLFHPAVDDLFLEQVFAVMALARQHTFQVLTKRPERMASYLLDEGVRDCISSQMDALIEERVDPLSRRRDDLRATAVDLEETWPLPNVWLGASAEDQPTFDERVRHLLRVPAAVRFLSLEPLLGEIENLWCSWCGCFGPHDCYEAGDDSGSVHWVIVGGESGPGARPFDLAWARSIVAQCQAAGVPCFVKQLGAHAILDIRYDRTIPGWTRRLRDRKGGDPEEWPEDLRVREFPS